MMFGFDWNSNNPATSNLKWIIIGGIAVVVAVVIIILVVCFAN
jgi:hypothetical protein